MKYLLVVLLIVMLVLSVSPVMAQDEMVVDYGTQVIQANPDNQLFQFVVIGLLFILIVALFVLGYSIRQLSQSAPAWLNQLAKPLVEQALTGVELITDATPNVIDDELLKEIRKIVANILNGDGETTTGYTIHPSISTKVTDVVEVSPDVSA